MRICLVAPGLMEVPPKSHGAVEQLIADYAYHLTELGHNVTIINEKSGDSVLSLEKECEPDITWIHYDRHFHLLNKLTGKKIIATTHNPDFRYLPPKGNYDIYALSQKQVDGFIAAGYDKAKIFLTPNGARTDLFTFNKDIVNDKLICLAKFSQRKRQHVLFNNPNIDLIGPKYPPFLTNHKGNWTKEEAYSSLTHYRGLILLSQHEGAPLVVPEALAAGLPVLISGAASSNMPDKPFIKILTEKEILVPTLRARCINQFLTTEFNREEVRQFAIDNFDWKKLTARLPFLQ